MAGISNSKGSKKTSFLEEKQWYLGIFDVRDLMFIFCRLHRIANELKSNRQWAQKWQKLNDSTLYSDEKGPKYPQKLAV